jgi:uncharacterized protein (TIGR03083 family)
MPGLYDHQRYCDLTGAEIRRFAAGVRGADPSTPVTTCGRWTLRDLVHHAGQIHRWAAGMVAVCSMEPRSRTAADWPLPPDPGAYADWLGEGERLLVPVLAAADPDAGMWAWGVDQHVRFWSRRMVHETAVHRVDAELALGLDPWVDVAVAVDGVGEFLENLPRARIWARDVGKLRGDGELIRLVATDRPDEWTIRLVERGFGWSHDTPDGDGNGEAPHPAGRSVTARASVGDLYLLVWGRRRFTDPRFAITGDSDLLAHWQQNSPI